MENKQEADSYRPVTGWWEQEIERKLCGLMPATKKRT
jgi:hypothetical protein